MDAIERWFSRAVIAPESLDPGDADIALLGELNHFVHEKTDFRLEMASVLAGHGFDVFGEELGWSDGARINQYLRTRDPAAFDRIALFGYRGDARTDRDDSPRGVFKASLDAYPFALMRAEQERFYTGLSAKHYFGFDVAAGHDGAYADMAKLDAAPPAIVIGESLSQEIDRLIAFKGALGSGANVGLVAAIDARIDGLIYAGLVRDAATYEATRPAMVFREDAMKRRLSDARRLLPGKFVLMGHAMHLAKDDRRIEAPGVVGPGGGHTSSLGHHIAQELRLKPFSIWMIYGAGRDSQPLPDLPNDNRYPADTLNARLARWFQAPTLLLTESAPSGLVKIGHMYNSVFAVDLKAVADAIYFWPKVSPLRSGRL